MSEDLNVILILIRFRGGGPVEAFLGGASLEGGAVKKNTLYEFLSNQVALATFKDPPVKPKNLESLPFFLVVLACLALIFSFLPTTG